MNDAYNKNKCQDIIWNLTTLSLENPNISPFLYLRELWEIRHDERECNISILRTNHAEQLGSDRIRRIMSYNDNKEDRDVAIRVLSRNRLFDNEQLLKALNIRNWLYYHTIYRFKRRFGTI